MAASHCTCSSEPAIYIEQNPTQRSQDPMDLAHFMFVMLTKPLELAVPVTTFWDPLTFHNNENMAVADTEPSPSTKIPRPFLIPTQIPSCQVS